MSNPYVDEVLADNPIGYWRLEETSGSTVVDEIGLNDGTVVGANLDVPSVEANLGSAASFDGTDDYIEIEANLLPISGSFSLECWLLAESTPDGDHRVYFNTAGGSRNYIYATTDFGSADNQVRAWMDGDERVVGSDIRGTGWRHLVVVRDGDVWRIYLDGALDAENTAPGDLDSYFDMQIGGVEAIERHHKGLIDEVAIYDYALSASRIQAHYDAAFASDETYEGATDNRTLLGIGRTGIVGVGGDIETITQVEASDSLSALSVSATATTTVTASPSDTLPALGSSALVSAVVTVEGEDGLAPVGMAAQVNVRVPTVNISEALPNFDSQTEYHLTASVESSDVFAAFDGDTSFTFLYTLSSSDALSSLSSETSVWLVPSYTILSSIPSLDSSTSFTIYPYPMSLFTLSDGRRAPTFTHDNIRVPVYLGQHR